MFVSTFHSSKLTARNWRMHALADFMESLTQEQDNLLQMGTIKYTKYQSLVFFVSNQSKGKNKFEDLKQQREKEKKLSDTENQLTRI